MRLRAAVLVVLGTTGCNGFYGLTEPSLLGSNPRVIRFDNSASTIDLVDFPVLLELDSARIDYSEVIDPNTDLRFEDVASGLDMPFEVEGWHPDGVSAVWVHVPVIHARSTTDEILMFFGATARGQADANATWTGYDYVLHGRPDDYANAASGMYAGTPTGVTSVPGIVGDGLGFSGGAGTHVIAVPQSGALLSGWNQFTIELWIYADFPTQNLGGEPRVFDKPGAASNGRLITVNTDGYARVQLDLQFQNRTSTNTFGTLRTQVWVYTVWAYDGVQLWLYRDAAPYAVEQGNIAPLALSARDLSFGSDIFKGVLDEIRISSTFHDYNWIDAQYRSMTDRFVVYR